MQCSGGYCRRGRGTDSAVDRLVLHVKDPANLRTDCVTTLCVECVQKHHVVCSTCGAKMQWFSTYTDATCKRASPVTLVDAYNATSGAASSDDDDFLDHPWHEQPQQSKLPTAPATAQQ